MTRIETNKSFLLCQELIWLTDKTNTYCMRERGHAGEHNIVNEEPPKKEKENETDTTNRNS